MWRKLCGGLLLQGLLLVVQGVACLPCAQAAPPTIAVILPTSPPHLAKIYEVFVQQFAGLPAGRTAPRFYLQHPNDDPMSLRNSARKAVALNADLIIAIGTSAALAAKAETFETPVLFADVIEPEAIGLVTQNKRDNQLATGVRGNAPLQTLFKLLREMTSVSKLALILDGDIGDKQLTAVLKDAAKRRGFEVVPISVRDKSAAAVVRAVTESGADGVFFVEDKEKFQPILDLAQEKKLPVISIAPGMAERGALLVMEVSPEEQGKVLAEMAKQLMEGAFPEHLPVAAPRQSGIIINLKSAQQYGMQIPFEVLSQATRVIR